MCNAVNEGACFPRTGSSDYKEGRVAVAGRVGLGGIERGAVRLGVGGGRRRGVWLRGSAGHRPYVEGRASAVAGEAEGVVIEADADFYLPAL